MNPSTKAWASVLAIASNYTPLELFLQSLTSHNP